ncbi:uncharacterized protein I303_103727 [Kwoniella dejecticola CBS 10117]|uniref:Uncharacterized protein n=1 Tax=Kwoniella dejecticola CBS 10117 TaxID=1296121 RepID=A0AAJ8MH62_9TREE
MSTQYLSSISANALISDLRPTTLSVPALQLLNAFLDEVLVSLITAAESLNPSDLRKEGIPSVFSAPTGSTGGENSNLRALGRSAVAEAEVELRSWLEGKGPTKGFAPDNQGTGMRNGRIFNPEKAIELMQFKCVSYSTMASQDPTNESSEEDILTAWKKVGGDAGEDTVEPAALWITAIIEHVCEHVLSQLASVVARDSEIVVAGPQELYTALCEDVSVWGLFKKMKVKIHLEAAIRAGTRHKRSTPSRPSTGQSAAGRASPSMSGSPHASRVSLGHHKDGSLDTTRNITSSPSQHDRSSMETNRFGGISGGVIRKGSQLSKKSGSSPGSKHHLLRGQGQGQSHERSGSVLSENTRSMLGAFHDTHGSEATEEDEQSIQEAQDEFDALVRSGETMKVSLTPSRLKNFDGGNNRRRAAESPNPSLSARSARSDNITPSQFPTPPSTQPRSSTTEQHSQNSYTLSSPTQYSALSPANRPRADSAQRRLQARAASTIEEKVDEEEVASMSKKESLMELLASEGALEDQSPIKKNGVRSSSPEEIRRTVPAVVLGTPPPPPPQSTFSSPPTHDLNTPKAGDFATHQPDIVSSPVVPNGQAQYSPQPVLTRSQYSSSSLNRPNGKTNTPPNGDANAEDDFAFTGQRRPRMKTEAQELADFFNNTPPPTNEPTFKSQPQSPTLSQGEGFSEPPQTAKSGKGFRALLSKATKSSKKEKEKDKDKSPQLGTSASYSKLNSTSNLNVSNGSKHQHSGSIGKSEGPKITGWAGFEDPNSPPQLGKNGGMTMPKKQKSLHSLSNVPTAFRPFAKEEDLTRDNQARKGSNASRTSDYAREAAAKYAERRNSAAALADRRGSAGLGPSALGTGERRGSESTIGVGDRRGSASATGPPPISQERRGSQPLHSPTQTTVNGRPAVDGESKRMIGLGIGSAPSGAESNNGTIEKGSPPVLEDIITSSSPHTRRPESGLEGLKMPGSATSFKTAHSILSPPSAIDRSQTHIPVPVPIPSPTKSVGSVSVSKSTSTGDIIIPRKPLVDSGTQTPPMPTPTPTTPPSPVPSIKLTDLVPLRRLLEHATTVMECKLLLDAILSQYGVPRSLPHIPHLNSQSEGQTQVNVGPEDRVTAWLLAGRDGPVGDVGIGARSHGHPQGRVPEGADSENDLSRTKESMTNGVSRPSDDRDNMGEGENAVTETETATATATEPDLEGDDGIETEVGTETDIETGVIIDSFRNVEIERRSPVKLTR